MPTGINRANCFARAGTSNQIKQDITNFNAQTGAVGWQNRCDVRVNFRLPVRSVINSITRGVFKVPAGGA